MNCESLRDNLSLYLYGELGFDEETAVEEHLSACAGCRRELERERALHAGLDRHALVPSPRLLVSCRRGLRSALEAQAASGPMTWKQWLASTFALAGPWLKPAGALAFVALGFLGGRWFDQVSPAAPAPDRPDLVATRVRHVQPDRDGRVRLVLEETRQRTLTGAPTDDRIQKLLLAAAKDPADAGLRVDSVELLRRYSGAQEVRRVLLAALERDPNPGVRLKALEGLRSFAGDDPEARRVLAKVLLKDDNVAVRTQAIDLLVQNMTDDSVGILQQLMRQEDNDYIRQQGERALRAVKASVETF